MTCNACGTDLICRTKDYGGTFKPTLQWQNYDGSAHYKTSDGKNFSCNVPEDNDPGQAKLGDSPAKTPKDGTMSATELAMLSKIIDNTEGLLHEVERIKDMVEPLFHKMVDEQIGRKIEE